MTDLRIQVNGLKAFRNDLRALDVQFPVELRAVNKEAAGIVAWRAQEIVPVRRTGRLFDSIKAQASGVSAYVKAGTSTLPYAGVIHFGWPKHHIKPNPFLYKALDQRRDEVIARYDVLVQTLARKAFPE